MIIYDYMKDKPVVLPKREAEADGSQLPGRPEASYRILVVDDEDNTRRLNATMLTQAGYEVDTANNGAEGWEALQSGCYDLLITDNSMPKVTGVEMLKKLRAAHMTLPAIMATGAIPTAEFARQPWLQPDATLVRPYTVEQLLKTVELVLRVADAREGIKPQ
jgi:DNA-binding response OmpR family regulator